MEGSGFKAVSACHRICQEILKGQSEGRVLAILMCSETLASSISLSDLKAIGALLRRKYCAPISQLDNKKDLCTKISSWMSQQHSFPHQSVSAQGLAASFNQTAPSYFPSNVMPSLSGPKPFTKEELAFNDETKSEPKSLESLLPLNPTETKLVEKLSVFGFSKRKCIETLRNHSCNYDRAYQFLMMELTDFREAKIMDQVALESENTLVADLKRNKKELQVKLSCTDVLDQGTFDSCLLLDDVSGAGSTLRPILRVNYDDYVDMSNTDMRDLCIKLLVLETKCTSWYQEGSRAYMEGIVNTLKGAKAIDISLLETLIRDIETDLYSMPENAGEMPPPFLKALSQSSSHENDIQVLPKKQKVQHIIDLT